MFFKVRVKTVSVGFYAAICEGMEEHFRVIYIT